MVWKDARTEKGSEQLSQLDLRSVVGYARVVHKIRTSGMEGLRCC